MAGFSPAIHDFMFIMSKMSMAGTSPAMTRI
jgi:hypothetical protein